MFRNWLVIIVLLLPILGYAGKKNKPIECTSSGNGFWECGVPSKKAHFDDNESDAITHENSNNLSAEDGGDFSDLEFGDLEFGDLEFGENKKARKKVVKVSVDENQNNCCFYVFFDQVNDNNAMRIALSAYYFPCKKEDEDIIIKSSDLGSEIVSSSSDVVMIYGNYSASSD